MHILLDMQSCQSESRLRGIGRYTLSLAKAIIRNPAGHKVSLLLNGLYSNNSINAVRQEFVGLIPADQIFVFSAQGPIAFGHPANRARNHAAKIARDLAIANINADIVCNMSFSEGYSDNFVVSISDYPNGARSFSIVYDLIPLLNKDVYLADPTFRQFYLDKLHEMEKADGLLAISSSASNEVKMHMDIAHDRVTNISSATDAHFQIMEIDHAEKQRLLDTYGISGEFIMTIGVLEPRKNIEALIHAYSLITPEVRSQHTLVLACQIKPHDKERLKSIAEKYGLRETEIAFTGFIPDDDLVALYNICRLFVFPSIHEGFGLPPLEAMCCGAATIASNTTSLPEVMGWDDAMFDPHNVPEMAALMEKSLTDESFHLALVENAKRQATLFSWDKCAQTALDAFERSVERDSAPTVAPGKALELAIEQVRKISEPALNDVDTLGVAWSLARNNYHTQKKQLLVDISVLVQHDARTGIQRVVRSVLSSLLEQGCEGYTVRPVYCQMGKLFHYANKYVAENYSFKNPSAEKEGMEYGDDVPVLFGKDDILLGLDLTAHLFPYLNTQLDNIRKTGTQVYYVVYDLIPLIHPEWTDANVRAAFPMWIKSLAEHTDGMVCISNSVADELKQWLKDHAADINLNPYLKIKHFHLGADLSASVPSFGRPDNADLILKKISESPVFLMVSTIEPRKGHAQVLAAFETLWQQGVDCTLLIVGKKGWGVEELAGKIEKHAALNKKLFWLNGIGDDFLAEIYSRSQALIVASLAEGFGLPIIEAAQQGLPIIARDIPVLREVAGEHALYFKGESPESIEKAILDWLDMNSSGAVIESKNIPWLTWKESTQQLIAQLPLSKLQ